MTDRAAVEAMMRENWSRLPVWVRAFCWVMRYRERAIEQSVDRYISGE